MANIYANRVSGEHPRALWPLDDSAHYLSLLSETQRDLTLWTTVNVNTGLTVKDLAPQTSSVPFPNSVVTKVVPQTSGVSNDTWKLSLASIFSTSSINGVKTIPTATYTWSGNVVAVTSNSHGLVVGTKIYLDFTSGTGTDGVFTVTSVTTNTFTVTLAGSGTSGNVTGTYVTAPVAASVYVWFPAAEIQSVSFGSTNSYDINLITPGASGEWVKITAKDVSPWDENLFIEFKAKSGGGLSSIANGTVYVNGLSLGQYSEPSAAESLGVQVVSPPASLTADNSPPTLPVSGVSVFKGKTSTLSSPELYYVSRNNKLLAFNAGIPLCYGSGYATRIVPVESPNEGTHPSLVFDGLGFLADSGRYDTYSVEFWLKVSGTTTQSRKIFGPTQSPDGLYICDGILSFVINGQSVSVSVGVFTEPMLIHLRYGGGKYDVLINGELMGSGILDQASLTLASVNATLDRRWLGFWTYSDLGPIDIGCVSIYGYLVPESVAKRRFVWGQGVADVNYTNSSFGGETLYSDASTTNNAYNVSYPNNAFWGSGVHDNLDVSSQRASISDRPLPEFFFGSKSQGEWYKDLYSIQTGDGWFSFRPTGAWSAVNAYIYFDELNRFSPDTRGISLRWSTPAITTTQTYSQYSTLYTGQSYSGVEATGPYTYGDLSIPATAQPLAVIKNKADPSQYLYLCTDSSKIYLVWADGALTTKVFEQAVSINTEYISYINIDSLLSSAGSIPQSLVYFLANKNSWDISVGGDGTRTFEGKIFNFSFLSKDYNDKAKAVLSNGLLIQNVAYNSTTHALFNLCSYTLLPMKRHGYFYADIGLRGYWEDYIPLSQIAGAYTSSDGKTKYGIDHIQFNIGYPVSSSASQPALPSTWTYADLATAFAGIPLSMLYGSYSLGFSTYADLVTKNFTGNPSSKIDTTQMFVRSYVSFQNNPKHLKSLDELSGYIPPTTSTVVYGESLPSPFDVKIEVVDGTTVVPPQFRGINGVVLSVYLDYAVKGIKTYPVGIKSLEVSSYVGNKDRLTAYGSKYSKPFFPFTKTLYGYDYSSASPIRVNKRGFPLLYTGRESGFTPVGQAVPGTEKGLMTQFFANGVDTEVDSFQMWVKRKTPFPATETPIAELAWVGGLRSLEPGSRFIFTVAALPNDPTRGVVNVYTGGMSPAGATVLLYQNGNSVARQIISLDEWTALGYTFTTTDARKQSGQIFAKVYPGMTYDNVSIFGPIQTTGATVVYQTWGGITATLWSAWTSEVWNKVLSPTPGAIKTRSSAKAAYDAYVGKSVISVPSYSNLVVKDASLKYSSGISWFNQMLIPT